MWKSNEYIRLKGLRDTKSVDIIPATEFNLPEGAFLNLNYARLIDGDKTKVLNPGETINIEKPKVVKKATTDGK